MSEKKTDEVQLIAADSFHTSQTGTVSARAAFTTHRAHADDLIKRGLAVEGDDKRVTPADVYEANETAEKKAADASNKKAPELSNKAKK